LRDTSGAISAKELLGVMRAMGQKPTEDKLNNLVMEVDLDGNELKQHLLSSYIFITSNNVGRL
jgi:Ca2+-binding EF-hand superfamily protein